MTRPATRHVVRDGSRVRSGPTLLERAGILLILTFPIIGTFFTPEAYFAPQDFSLVKAGGEAAWSIPFARLAVVFILGWLAIHMAPRFETLVPFLSRSMLPLIYVGCIMLSSVISVDPMYSFNRGIRVVAAVLFAYYIVYRLNEHELLATLTLAFSISIGLSFLAVAAFPQYGYSTLVGYADAWRGAFSHKNSLGAAMSTAVIVGYFSTKLPRRSPLSIFVVLGGSVLLLLSRSATAAVALVTCMACLPLLSAINRAKTEDKPLLLWILSALVILAAGVGPLAFDEFLILIGRSPNLTGRTDVWNAAWWAIQERPLWGFGNAFWSVESPTRNAIWETLQWTTPHAHNTLLDIWLQLGLYGLIVGVLMIVAALYRAIRALVISIAPVSLVWVFLLLSLMFRSWTETSFVEPGSGAMFWLVLSYASLAKLGMQSRSRYQAHSKLTKTASD